MRSLLIALFAALLATAPLARAQDNAPPLAKMLRYSSACEERQLARLLQAHPTLDPHGSPSAFSPFYNAATGWLAAVNTGAAGLAFQNKCATVMMLFLDHPKYDWKRSAKQGVPDVYLFLSMAGKLSGDYARTAFRNTLTSVFSRLAKKPDFDINHILPGPTPPGEAQSMLDVLALFSAPEIVCDLIRTYPTARIDLRKGPTHFTPLLIAIKAGRLDIVRLLIGEGADWLIDVQGVSGTAAFTIATQNQRTLISAFLVDHEQRREPGTPCAPR